MSSPQPTFRPSFDTCTDVTPLCPASATVYGDFFNLAGSAIFLSIFTLCLIIQIFHAIRGKTISFSVFLAIGTGFEIMGYGARIAMSPIGTVWTYPGFVIQLLMLILGPTLVAAAISVTFKWIVIQEGAEYSLFRPKLYPLIFVYTDFFSIIIQAAGGAVSATATSGSNTNQALLDAGSGLLVAGVAFQAANMAFCGGLMIIWFWRFRRGAASKSVTEGREPAPFSWKPDTKFKKYVWALVVSYIAVLIRCIYRDGDGLGIKPHARRDPIPDLRRDVSVARAAGRLRRSVILLTTFHPAIFFPLLRQDHRKAAAAASAPATTPDSEVPPPQ